MQEDFLRFLRFSLFNFYNIFYPFSGYLNSDYFYRLCHKNKLQRTSLVMVKHKNKLVANENCFTLSSQLYQEKIKDGKQVVEIYNLWNFCLSTRNNFIRAYITKIDNRTDMYKC